MITSEKEKTLPASAVHEQTDAKVVLRLKLSENILFFAGHFPEQPVLAGVVQLHWATHYCNEYFPGLSEVAAVERLKFQQVVVPEQYIDLELQHIGQNKVEFKYLRNNKVASSGRILFSTES